MKPFIRKHSLRNRAGMITADFLFSFVLVIGVGVFIFAITFSLATIEVAQYIVWSAARNYSAAHVNQADAQAQAEEKFNNLAAKFPLLTNSNNSSGWFELNNFIVGELDDIDPDLTISADDKRNDFRQPWTGASAKIKLKLFAGLQIPFLGPVVDNNEGAFEFPVRAFIIRQVSEEECEAFFLEKRYNEGIKKLENGDLAPEAFGFVPPRDQTPDTHNGEDNGC